MASIHDIKTAQVRRSVDQAANRPVTAQIIIFPGVRYERATGLAQAATTEQRARRRERDMLEIVD